MTDSINKRLHANDKMLENINAKLDDFSSTIKNQLSFNKMLETQLTQLALLPQLLRKEKFLASLKISWRPPMSSHQGMILVQMVGEFLLRKVI